MTGKQEPGKAARTIAETAENLCVNQSQKPKQEARKSSSHRFAQELIDRITEMGFKENKAGPRLGTEAVVVTSYRRGQWTIIPPTRNKPWTTAQHEVRGSKEWFIDFPVEMGIDLTMDIILTLLAKS